MVYSRHHERNIRATQLSGYRVTVQRERVVVAERTSEDVAELSLRPRLLREFIGQDKIKENLVIFIEAALAREEPLDHVLLYGPPGLGKTTLAYILANEMGVKVRITSGPAIERPGDLASVITNLGANDVLFIDEIHRLRREVEEVLYSAMEDFALDIMVGKGASARNIRLALPKFSVIGATTRPASLSAPLRDRFGVVHRLDFYDHAAMHAIVLRGAGILRIHIDNAGAETIARRGRGTPRVALRLLRRVRDYAEVRASRRINAAVADAALSLLDIDELGLDDLDRRVLEVIAVKFGGGPVGLDTIAAALGEEPQTIEDVVEPYLLQLAFLDRTSRGRVATERACDHLGVPYKAASPQTPLF